MADVPHVVLDTNVLISAVGWDGPPDDDRVLECAVEGHVAMIITGDLDLRVLTAFEGIPIRLAREAVEHFHIASS